MIELDKGQYFIGKDNKKYIFLGYKNKNIFYCLEEDYEYTDKVLLFDSEFIYTSLEESNEKVKEMTWYFQCYEEYERTNLKEKIDRLLINVNNNIKKWEEEINYLNLDIRIKKISDLVKAKAFFNAQNQYYEVIGFCVETETYEKSKKIEENTGVFAIYHSKCDDLAPLTFFYNEDKNKFYNKGTKDYCIVEEILVKEKEISRYIKENNVLKTKNKQDNEISR